MRRFPLSFLLVGLLGLLAAGGAVLGAFQAPTGTDLAVHNGAGQTLSASQITGSYTASYFSGAVISFGYRPGQATEVARAATGAVKARRTVHGTAAQGILQPVRALLSIPTFSAHDGTYRSTQPASVLLPPAQRAGVTGTYRTDVQLTGGYVVDVHLSINAVQRGQHITETVDYRLSRVDGWKRG